MTNLVETPSASSDLIDIGAINSTLNFFTKKSMLFQRIVQHGEKLGRTLNFPTLNFEVEDLAEHLDHGVHAAWVWIETIKYKGALYLGPKTAGEIVLEVHVLDFDREIYGQVVDVRVLQKIRGPQKFKDLEEMTKAIAKDVEEIRELM